jgi:aldose 1-epimerase
LFRFTNEAGAIADITNYGGRLVRILVPDKNGKLTSVIKGYETWKVSSRTVATT